MRHRKLGNSGTVVSKLALGTGHTDQLDVRNGSIEARLSDALDSCLGFKMEIVGIEVAHFRQSLPVADSY